MNKQYQEWINLINSCGNICYVGLKSNWTGQVKNAYPAFIPSTEVSSGDTVIVKMYEGSIYKLTTYKYSGGSWGLVNPVLLSGNGVQVARDAYTPTATKIGNRAFDDNGSCYSYNDGPLVAVSLDPKVTAFYYIVGKSTNYYPGEVRYFSLPCSYTSNSKPIVFMVNEFSVRIIIEGLMNLPAGSTNLCQVPPQCLISTTYSAVHDFYIGTAKFRLQISQSTGYLSIYNYTGASFTEGNWFEEYVYFKY